MVIFLLPVSVKPMNILDRSLNVSKFGESRNEGSPSLGKITNGRRYKIFDQVLSHARLAAIFSCKLNRTTETYSPLTRQSSNLKEVLRELKGYLDDKES